jgi:hypothetical protein
MLLAGLALATLLVGCARPASGRVTFAFTMAAGETAGLTDIRVEPAWGGVNRGPERDANWVRVPAVPPSSPLPTVPGGQGVTVARGSVPAGRYDRVYVATPRVTARAPDQRVVEVVSHIEPTVRPLVVGQDGDVTVDIELVIRPLPAWDGPGWAAFVKGARAR